MQRYLKLNGIILLFFILLITIVSCSNDNTKQQKKEEASTDTGALVTQPQQVKAMTISGTLDTLWTDSLSFAKLPNAKMVFSFTFTSTDKLTMHGWHAKGILGNSFDQDPDIKLNNGRPGSYKYSSDMYFGNVVLKDVNDIQKALKKYNAKYVLFVPYPVGTYHIGYKIYVTSDDPSFLKLFSGTYTGIDANPSPPKTY